MSNSTITKDTIYVMTQKASTSTRKKLEWLEGHKINGRPVKNGRCIICDTTEGYFQWNSERLGYECTVCLGTINTALRDFGDSDIVSQSEINTYYASQSDTQARTNVSLSNPKKSLPDI